jgi:hypothetical protein
MVGWADGGWGVGGGKEKAGGWVEGEWGGSSTARKAGVDGRERASMLARSLRVSVCGRWDVEADRHKGVLGCCWVSGVCDTLRHLK